MLRSLAGLVAGLALATPIFAHFVFVVPKKGNEVEVVFSDSLEPDEDVPIAKIAALQLFSRDDAGKETAVKTTTDKFSLKASAPTGTRVLYGSIPYGVMQKGDASPYQLSYHPKAILGDALAKPLTVGEKLPIEILTVGKAGQVRFQVLAKGKPLPGAELNVLVPGAAKKKVTTDAEGLSPTFSETGRYGIWTKHTDKTAGESAGKKYDEVRNYATLVVDIGGK